MGLARAPAASVRRAWARPLHLRALLRGPRLLLLRALLRGALGRAALLLALGTGGCGPNHERGWAGARGAGVGGVCRRTVLAGVLVEKTIPILEDEDGKGSDGKGSDGTQRDGQGSGAAAKRKKTWMHNGVEFSSEPYPWKGKMFFCCEYGRRTRKHFRGGRQRRRHVGENMLQNYQSTRDFQTKPKTNINQQF